MIDINVNEHLNRSALDPSKIRPWRKVVTFLKGLKKIIFIIIDPLNRYNIETIVIEKMN